MCWPFGDVGLLSENLVGEAAFTYSESSISRKRGDGGTV